MRSELLVGRRVWSPGLGEGEYHATEIIPTQGMHDVQISVLFHGSDFAP